MPSLAHIDRRFQVVASTAFQLLGKESFDFDPQERLFLVLLASTCQKLVVDDGKLDVQSTKGCAACQRFLRALEDLANALGLEPAPREYRATFTTNYKALFNGKDRCYRVDILQAATTLTPTIWANGEVFHLGAEVTQRADALHQAWFTLGHFLDESMSPERGSCHSRSELCAQLHTLDAAWASFEEVYVAELLRVQRRARTLVSEASLQEQHLHSLECAAGGAQAEERWRAETELVDHLGRLHMAAKVENSDRHPELPVRILDAARALLAQGRGAQPDPAVMLAERTVGSYRDLREYLRKVRGQLGKVHPQLCKNTGLTERLACWEESWRRSEYYSQNPDLLEAVRHLAHFLWTVQYVAPSLRQLCENYDAELFLILPRLVCLCLFSDPGGPVEALARRLLPHHFAAAGEQQQELSTAHGQSKIQATSAHLQRALGTVVASLMAGDSAGMEADAWIDARETLVRRAVAGASGQDPYTELEQPWRELAVASVEGFMNEVEGWSMELQRHSPEAWNELSGLLVQCIAWRPGDGPAPARFAT